MRDGKIISIINYKGGVGKTTGTFNIGTGLSFLAQKKVLLIDLDPQCSLTTMALKAYSRKIYPKNSFLVKDLKIEQTINHVIKSYVKTIGIYGKDANIDIDNLILKDFYKGEKQTLSDFDIIPATMFDKTNSSYFKGLDDLEMEISSCQTFDISGKKEMKFDMTNFVKLKELVETSRISQLSLFAKFFTDFKLKEKYDFIIFDCPPANSIITQNALIVSDYYLVPTIMDFMSSNGIVHFDSLIQNTILNKTKSTNKKAINGNEKYLDFFKKDNAKLLGIYESIKKTNVDTGHYRAEINNLKSLKGKLFNEIIYHHIDTARATGNGKSVFSVYVDKGQYSPHTNYAELIKKILRTTGVSFTRNLFNQNINEWL